MRDRRSIVDARIKFIDHRCRNLVIHNIYIYIINIREMPVNIWFELWIGSRNCNRARYAFCIFENERCVSWITIVNVITNMSSRLSKRNGEKEEEEKASIVGFVRLERAIERVTWAPMEKKEEEESRSSKSRLKEQSSVLWYLEGCVLLGSVISFVFPFTQPSITSRFLILYYRPSRFDERWSASLDRNIYTYVCIYNRKENLQHCATLLFIGIIDELVNNKIDDGIVGSLTRIVNYLV